MRTCPILLAATAISVVAGSLAPGTPARAETPPARNADPDERAAATLALMTDEEALTLIQGQMPALIAPSRRPPGIAIGAGHVPGIPRLGIPPQVATDASLGVANLLDMRKGDVATALPSGLAMAATWNPQIVREAGRMIGAEARAKGFNVMLAGGVNLVRDPRAGRNFEYLGEDPLLAGVLAGEQISGVQSNDIIATIKHFALNDQETGRSSASVEMPEAAMRESDLLAFQIGIERGQPGSVMCAYNKVGGTFACENPFLLNQVLRHDWGFKGYVMSDWGAVHSSGAILAGLDQQSGAQLDRRPWFSTEMRKAMAEGRIPVSAVRRSAQRILRTIYAIGLEADPADHVRPIDYAAHAAIARQTAEEGIVLLRNEGGLLPLAATARRIVLIGGHGDIGVLSGGGSSQVTPVGGFRKSVNGGTGAAAFARRSWGGTSPLDGLRRAFPQAEVIFDPGSEPAIAADVARNADVAIVLAEKFATEAEDQRDLSLGGGQDELIAAVAQANPRTVVVLQTGNPVLMPWREKVTAILSAWFPGQEGGTAIARVLSGAVSPSGRLPVTFPASVEQLPNPVLPGADLPPPSPQERATYGINTSSPPFDITYPEGSDAGYRWFDRKGFVPLYPFGHGLAYTAFGYAGLKATGGSRPMVRFRITNTGLRTGQDVPQVYVTLPGKARRLAAWSKVSLMPDESRDVSLALDPRILASFDEVTRRWVARPEEVRIELSRSATEPVLETRLRLRGRKLKP